MGIKAGGKANYTFATKEAKAKARSHTLHVESKILKDIKDNLQLNPQDLLKYQQYASLQALENASLYYGFQDNTQILITARTSGTTAASSDRMSSLGGAPSSDAGSSAGAQGVGRTLMDEHHDEL